MAKHKIQDGTLSYGNAVGEALENHKSHLGGVGQADGTRMDSRTLWECGRQPRTQRLLNFATTIKQTTPPPEYMCCVCVCESVH